MLDGGGILSMLKVSAIICISSMYSGIFEKTGLLQPIRKLIAKAGYRLHPFLLTLLTSTVASAVACNQTFAIMLTNQLCASSEKDQSRFAIYLENSVVIVAALIPWSIAAQVPLTSVGAPMTAILTACYLYILPLWYLLRMYAGKSERHH